MKLPSLLLTLGLAALPVLHGVELKPRVLVLTDLKRTQETDDSQSLIRLLVHADLVEIEGIIVSSGMNYWEPRHAPDGYAYGFELLEAYRQTVPNLMKMAEQTGFSAVEDEQAIGYWPSPAYVLQRYALGTALQGLDQTGPGKANAGSRLITNVVDEPDERPVYVLAWGGANVLAQTLRDLTENPATRRSPEAVAAFVRKLRVIAIADQDQPWPQRRERPVPNNAGRWLRETFPDLYWLLVDGSGFPGPKEEVSAFYARHIQGHGPLGDAYPDHNHGIEGDTPALLHVLPLGFNVLERAEWGSAAGIHVYETHPVWGTPAWVRPGDDGREAAAWGEALSRRMTAELWRGFAARMDWARSGTGNRAPAAVVDGVGGTGALEREITVGERLTLDASGSQDREMDRLSFHWEVLPLPGTYAGAVELSGVDQPRLTLAVPAAAAGQTLHLGLTVTDEGAGHDLSSWRRVVVRVRP